MERNLGNVPKLAPRVQRPAKVYQMHHQGFHTNAPIRAARVSLRGQEKGSDDRRLSRFEENIEEE